MKKLFVVPILTLIMALAGLAQHDDHEYAPLSEKEISYRDWTYQNVKTNQEINLRDFTKDKKLVMVFYFAPWCHSSNYQAPITQRLYDKYRDQGFAVIGVSLYGSKAQVEDMMDRRGINFPVVVESKSKRDRENTLHFKYRNITGDYRKWGTPWNVFLSPDNLVDRGEILTEKTYVVNGEIRENEAEVFIRKKLWLSREKLDPKEP